MDKFFICILGLITTHSVLCDHEWYNYPHHHPDHETRGDPDPTAFSKFSDKEENGNYDITLEPWHHHHDHSWHDQLVDRSSYENVVGEPEAPSFNKNSNIAEGKKIFFGCIISKLIEKCIKNCQTTDDFDLLCGTQKCAASCGIDPSIILSKVCPQANIITYSATTATPVDANTPSEDIVVTNPTNIDYRSENKSNVTDPFKTPIFTSGAVLYNYQIKNVEDTKKN